MSNTNEKDGNKDHMGTDKDLYESLCSHQKETDSEDVEG